jgi:hypothetical protein
MPNIITVKLDTSDVLKHIEFFKDLPPVYIGLNDRYWTNEGIRWTPIDSDDPYNDINTHIRALVAIKLRMEADAKGPTHVIRAETEALAHKKAAAAKKAHDDLRTSPIALKALALRNKRCTTDHKSWDATNLGEGAADNIVQDWITIAEEAEKEAAVRLIQRRDAITVGLVGLDVTYESRSGVIKRAVDRIIELEDKAGK